MLAVLCRYPAPGSSRPDGAAGVREGTGWHVDPAPNSASSSRSSPDSQPCLTSCVRAARGWILTFYHHTLSRRPCPRNSISTQDRKCPPAVLLVVGEHDPVLLPASGTSLYSRTGRQERPTRTSCYLAITVLTSACISDCCIHYYRPHASCVRPLWTAPSAGELSAGRSRYVASVRGPASASARRWGLERSLKRACPLSCMPGSTYAYLPKRICLSSL